MPGSGGRSSGSGFSNYALSYEFDLLNDGTPSTFTGAIENFEGSFSGDEFVTTRDPRFDFFVDNPSKSISLSSETTDLAASFDQNRIRYQIAPTEYQYTDGSNNSQSGTVGLTFGFDDADGDPNNGFQVNIVEIDSSGNTTTETIDVDTEKATTSIDYIVSEGLFSYVDGITITGKDGNGNPFSAGVTSLDSSFTPSNPTDNPDPILNGDDVLTGDNGDNTLDGGEGNNVLRGQEGNDVLTTGAGSDNLDGGNGDDRLSSGGGNDILTGGAGSDLFDCGEGNDTVDGGDGNDDIFGAGGDDLIRGGNGDDILTGGAGLDVLVGDGGADIFEIGTAGGTDILRDFNYGQDLIGLSDGITFEDLIVTQGDGAAILSYQDQAIASISGGTPSQINASLFTEI